MNAEAAVALETQDTAPVAQDYLAHMQTKLAEPATEAVVTQINEALEEVKETIEAAKTDLVWRDTPVTGMMGANVLNGFIARTNEFTVFIPGFVVEDGLFRNIAFLKPMGKRGRPAGAKNKVKKIAKAPKAGKQKIKKPAKKTAGKRGRPAGSKNKAKGRGRPKGSKNKAK